MGFRIVTLPLMWGLISFICFQVLIKDQPQPTALQLEEYCQDSLDNDDLLEVQSFICLPRPEVSEASFELQKTEVLKDYQGRISSNFQIDDRLYPRVEFWFDIYTKYDSDIKLIHHEDFPWIIFRFVDTRNDELKKKSPIRFEILAELQVNKEVRRIKSELQQLSEWARKKDRPELSPVQSELVSKMELIPGENLSRKLKQAVSKVRVQTGQKNFFMAGLDRSKNLLPEMERIFMAQRLPIELTRLPFVESSFNHLATSKVGAAGLWQIMPHIGRHFFGDSKVDQRRLALPSTRAAAQILKENYLLLKNWGLAVTAYNHGPGGIRRALKRTGASDIEEIVDQYETARFSFASQNFYSEFLAALYAQMYSDQVFKEAPLVQLADSDELDPVDLASNEKASISQ